MKDRSVRFDLGRDIMANGGWIPTAYFQWHRIDMRLPPVLEQQWQNITTQELEWRSVPIKDDTV